MKPYRVYVDTSVIGGCLDEEFAADSLRLIESAKAGRVTLLVSAIVARADAIVSWNFRHIVRLEKIRAYNQVDLLHGYGVLTILSPKEVIFDEPTQG